MSAKRDDTVAAIIRNSLTKICVFSFLVAFEIAMIPGCGDDECIQFETFCIDTGNMNECPAPAVAEPEIRKANPDSNIVSVDSVSGPVNGPECCYASSVKHAPEVCDTPFDLTPGF